MSNPDSLASLLTCKYNHANSIVDNGVAVYNILKFLVQQIVQYAQYKRVV